MKHYFNTLLLAACLGSLIGCRQAGTADNERTRKETITVSIEPLRYIAGQIAGEHFNIETFVPKGSSPETYEPTPLQMMKLAESLAFFEIGGLGFERTWLDKLRQTNPKLPFVRTSNGITRLNGHHHGSHREIESDPHVWTTPDNMKVIAKNICTSLCQIDTASAGDFKKNLQKTLAELQSLDDSLHALTDTLDTRAFLIYHPTLTYFAHAYGLTQITMEADGKEPSPGQLAGLIATCKEKQVRIIFVQQEFDLDNAELIARETGTRIVNINPLSYEWKKEMLNIAKTLHAQ